MKIRLENDYQVYNSLIPRNGMITDIGCGYGFISYMLNLVSPQRQIIAIDYDEDKIEVARSCAIKNTNTVFVHEDINEYSLTNSDVFLLNDVLHYMPVDLQIDIINRCIMKLNPSGMIIIRDADSDLKKEHKATRLTEFFSTKSGFNKTKYKLSFISGRVIENIASKHKLKLEVISSSGLTSNYLYILRN